MPSNKSLVKASNGFPAQNYNPNTGNYEESYGTNNAIHTKMTDASGNVIDPRNVQITGRNAKEPFSGSANKTHTFTQSMNGFVISNDGASDLTFSINGGTFTVKPGEVFDDLFDPFTQVIITTTVPFRAFGRG